MRPEETIDFHLKYTWQNVSRMYNDVALNFGGTMSVGFVLLSIDIEEGTPSTALGPKMGMEPTSLSRILKTMEQNNLIWRKPNPKDGRGVLICLTEFGIEKREDAKEAVITFNTKVVENVSKQDLDTFIKVTKKVNQLIDDDKIYNNK